MPADLHQGPLTTAITQSEGHLWNVEWYPGISGYVTLQPRKRATLELRDFKRANLEFYFLSSLR
jgi:hypothetical protein